MERRSIKRVWIVERSARSVCLVVRGAKVGIVPLAAGLAGGGRGRRLRSRSTRAPRPPPPALPAPQPESKRRRKNFWKTAASALWSSEEAGREERKIGPGREKASGT
ncbi:Hypothetical predicted protein [Podarcis lilfordi]|uniref:Uncharacterized protein n=1 Tax=Podarcis lilfordi TaxID=74358 RepID=A0AA35K7S7_9SAUR|nr:Hypothetical predicted protein [Podarcis lilfordi]